MEKKYCPFCGQKLENRCDCRNSIRQDIQDGWHYGEIRSKKQEESAWDSCKEYNEYSGEKLIYKYGGEL